MTHSATHVSGNVLRNTCGVASLYRAFSDLVALLFCPLMGIPLLSAKASGMGTYCSGFFFNRPACLF